MPAECGANIFPAEQIRTGQLRGAELQALLRATDLRNQDLSGLDLSGFDLSELDLSGCNLFQANLRGTRLAGACLDGAELTGANLQGANLEHASGRGAGFGMCDLTEAQVFRADLANATLSGATLDHANFGCANLEGARLREASAVGVDFTSADLHDAELSLCEVAHATFNNADLRRSRLRGLSGFQKALWYGVDIRDVNFSGAYRVRRYIVDENYLKELREAGPVERAVYTVWSWTSDCGRSLFRWCLVLCIIATVFAVLFSLTDVQMGRHEPGALTYLYYSVVTITTLGYGDIVPGSGVAKLLVVLEVCTGYVLLGGMISIFANKLARRGE